MVVASDGGAELILDGLVNNDRCHRNKYVESSNVVLVGGVINSGCCLLIISRCCCDVLKCCHRCPCGSWKENSSTGSEL